MGIHRNQFTFYASFLAAAEQLPPKLRSEFLLIICRYALDEIEPETRSSTVKTAFELVRPVLDKARRKAMAGKSGGEASGEIRSKPEANRSKTKQTGSRPEAEETALYSEGEGEGEKEREHESEGEGEGYGSQLPQGNTMDPFSQVFEALRRREVFMSDKDKAECRALCAEYGSRSVIEAAERAEEAQAPRWPYIRAIVTSGGVGPRGGQGTGGMSQRVRESNAQCQRHDDPPTPAMLDAVRQMLAEPDDAEEGVAHERNA